MAAQVMFATHYHPISKEAVKDTLKVAPFHMAAAVNNQSNDMTFLYKFLPGAINKNAVKNQRNLGM